MPSLSITAQTQPVMPLVNAKPVPWEVRLHQNQLINRFVIDGLGYSLWSVVIARNQYERLEKAGDWLAWILAGLVIPTLVLTPFSRAYTARLARKFALPVLGKTSSPLNIPLQILDKAGFTARIHGLLQKEALPAGRLQKTLKTYGLQSFKQLTPQLADAVLWGKLSIIWADLIMLALKGQGYAWVKNWVTEKLSGKKGYAGEFNYANDQYLKHKSKQYEAHKTSRMLRSMLIGFSSALLFPLLLRAIIKHPNRSSSLMSFLKDKVKAFNYSDTIFMSKWVLLWHNLFNWTFPTLMASRDNHELRENAVKLATFDVLFFLGDDIFSGLYGQAMQKRYGSQLSTPIIKHVTRFKLPHTVPLHEIYQAVGQNTKNLAYRLARQSAWVGLLGTALVMGVSMPLLNFWYTRKKVEAEQALLQIKKTLTHQTGEHSRKQPNPAQAQQLAPITPTQTYWTQWKPQPLSPESMPFLSLPWSLNTMLTQSYTGLYAHNGYPQWTYRA